MPGEGTEFPILKPLLGSEDATIDGKGRILIGKKNRERLGDGFAICQGDNGCLWAVPGAAWEAFLREVYSASPTSQGKQDYTRLVLSTADDDLKFDDQGRVVVPRRLRDLAKFDKDVVLLGCGDRLEIWAAEEYKKFCADEAGYGLARRQAIQVARDRMMNSK